MNIKHDDSKNVKNHQKLSTGSVCYRLTAQKISLNWKDNQHPLWQLLKWQLLGATFRMNFYGDDNNFLLELYWISKMFFKECHFRKGFTQMFPTYCIP